MIIPGRCQSLNLHEICPFFRPFAFFVHFALLQNAHVLGFFVAFYPCPDGSAPLAIVPECNAIWFKWFYRWPHSIGTMCMLGFRFRFAFNIFVLMGTSDGSPAPLSPRATATGRREAALRPPPGKMYVAGPPAQSGSPPASDSPWSSRWAVQGALQHCVSPKDNHG